MRRRPLLRAAVVGGTAYVAGKRVSERESQTAYAQQQAMEAQQIAYEAQEQARQTQMQQQQVQMQQQMQSQAQPQMVPAGMGSVSSQDRLDQLTKLAALHDAGALTDAEFENEKRRLLAG